MVLLIYCCQSRKRVIIASLNNYKTFVSLYINLEFHFNFCNIFLRIYNIRYNIISMNEQNSISKTSIVNSFTNIKENTQLIQQDKNLVKQLQQKIVELRQKDDIISQLREKQKKIILYEQKIIKLQNKINMLEDLMNRTQQYSFDQFSKASFMSHTKRLQSQLNQPQKNVIQEQVSLTQRNHSYNPSSFTAKANSQRQKTDCSQLSSFQTYKPRNYQNYQFQFLRRQRILSDNISGIKKNKTFKYDQGIKEEIIRDNKGFFDPKKNFRNRTLIYDQFKQRQNAATQGITRKGQNRQNFENIGELEIYKRQRLIYTPNADQFLKIHKCYQNFRQ